MAATTVFNNQHGAATGTEQAVAVDAYMLSADIASSTANRDANSVLAPASGTTYSFDRWTLLEATGGSFTTLNTFRHYAASYSAPTGVVWNTSAQNPSIDTLTYLTPVGGATQSTKADTAMVTTDAAAERIQGSIASVGQKSEYGVVQVAVTSTATVGFETMTTWAWNEVA